VVAGPDPERDKVARWRRVDLRAEVARRFGVEVREGTIGEWLHQLGLTLRRIYREFRVWGGTMLLKEPSHAATQTACHPG
jgi:Winged helix-turn helix